MSYTNDQALKLPDELLVRYFRAGEIERITSVETRKRTLVVKLKNRTDRWKDGGGEVGYVPDQA